MTPTPGPQAEQVRKEFFHSRVLEKNEDDFEDLAPTDELRDEIVELIQNKREELSGHLEEFGEPISTIAQNVLLSDDPVAFPGGPSRDSDSRGATKYVGSETENPVLLITLEEADKRRWRHPSGDSTDQLRIGMISTSREDGEQFMGWYLNEVHEIKTYVGEYAEVKKLKKGGEIVHEYFDDKVKDGSNLEDWHQDEFKNDFEETVYENIRDLVGTALSNVRIEADVGDNPDFDTVMLPLGGLGTNYALEVKDYLQEDNPDVEEKPSETKEPGELRSELIRKPKEFAEQADLKLITIVKGLSDEQYNSLNRLADSSNVTLLNEDNYESFIEDAVFKQGFRESSEYIL